MSAWAERPDASEHAPFYAGYVERVPDGDVRETLDRDFEDTLALLRSVEPAREGHRYADGKWSIREVVGHCADAERIFASRALWGARGDRTPLPGFDEKAWAEASPAHGRELAALADEWATVRRATVTLLRGLTEEDALRRFTANDASFTVRAQAWIAAGHELHHRAVLVERYLDR